MYFSFLFLFLSTNNLIIIHINRKWVENVIPNLRESEKDHLVLFTKGIPFFSLFFFLFFFLSSSSFQIYINYRVDKETGQFVAIKALNLQETLDDLDMIQQEIAFMTQLDSPYVTHYYGSYVVENELWIVMEYVAGGSVYDLVNFLSLSFFFFFKKNLTIHIQSFFFFSFLKDLPQTF